ncbi:ATP-grasp domain-containing protein [Alcanivorax quisquiliarum]|uniref:ATP-grasp domain-containing protein n=1 Tax=Alcanivorax quisquiliarum TaxID=2933565 RepID=A0ABT0E9D9_9GAMM|nr:ATP-grasp domain-containing protein [Alcanivorax quisquiliarum]MCK0538414.1 ATP-grasp domain-containing protein [Alcanivorax quisquiliarum]
MPHHIVIPALADCQRTELETLRNAGDCLFHPLLDVRTLVEAGQVDFNALLQQCRTALAALGVPITGLIAHWDFPTSVLVPMLSRDQALPSPSLESVLMCEHKYWSRLLQQQVIPEYVPRFSVLDPFSEHSADNIGLPFPFWIKPVKSFSSQLGFRIENTADLEQALAEIRAGIGHLGDAFDQALAHIDLPASLHGIGGRHCIIEEIVEGVQVAPEGSVADGHFQVHGLFDMQRDAAGQRYENLIYPSSLPRSVQEDIAEACRKFLHHIGFDNGCFNAEFIWDAATDQLRVIEFNTRISQSHSEMFVMVDGVSNHEVALDVLLGRTPQMPRGEGRYPVAGKFSIPYPDDAIVTAVPDKRDMQTLAARFPGLDIRLHVSPGMRLSTLPNQDSYCYQLGDIYLGAESREALLANYQACLQALPFAFEPLLPQGARSAQAAGAAHHD